MCIRDSPIIILYITQGHFISPYLHDADILPGLELFWILLGNRVTRPVYKIMEIGFKKNFGTSIIVHIVVYKMM